MPILIGLTGLRGSGKDTAFGFIQEWAAERGVRAYRRGFADAVKLSFARLFIPDISLQEAVIWCDELKQEPARAELQISWTQGFIGDSTETTITHKINGRQVLQRYGTEAHREVFGPDFWVDALLPIDVFIDENDLPTGPKWPFNFRGPMDIDLPEICAIPDTRFESEADRIKLLRGEIWRVVRYEYSLDDSHASEVPLHEKYIDVTLENVWNKQELLREQVFSNMERITAEERV